MFRFGNKFGRLILNEVVKGPFELAFVRKAPLSGRPEKREKLLIQRSPRLIQLKKLLYFNLQTGGVI